MRCQPNSLIISGILRRITVWSTFSNNISPKSYCKKTISPQSPQYKWFSSSNILILFKTLSRNFLNFFFAKSMLTFIYIQWARRKSHFYSVCRPTIFNTNTPIKTKYNQIKSQTQIPLNKLLKASQPKRAIPCLVFK